MSQQTSPIEVFRGLLPFFENTNLTSAKMDTRVDRTTCVMRFVITSRREDKSSDRTTKEQVEQAVHDLGFEASVAESRVPCRLPYQRHPVQEFIVTLGHRLDEESGA